MECNREELRGRGYRSYPLYMCLRRLGRKERAIPPLWPNTPGPSVVHRDSIFRIARSRCVSHLWVLLQHLSSTAYISGVYGLSLTTRPFTSTQACALNGICCAPMTI